MYFYSILSSLPTSYFQTSALWVSHKILSSPCLREDNDDRACQPRGKTRWVDDRPVVHTHRILEPVAANAKRCVPKGSLVGGVRGLQRLQPRVNALTQSCKAATGHVIILVCCWRCHSALRCSLAALSASPLSHRPNPRCEDLSAISSIMDGQQPEFSHAPATAAMACTFAENFWGEKDLFRGFAVLTAHMKQGTLVGVG